MLITFPSENPWEKSWHTFPPLQYLSGKFTSSSPCPNFNVAHRDKVVCNIVWGWGKFPILVMSFCTFSYYLVKTRSCYLIQVCQGILSWIVGSVYSNRSINFQLYGKLLVVQNEFFEAVSTWNICYEINDFLTLTFFKKQPRKTTPLLVDNRLHVFCGKIECAFSVSFSFGPSYP